MIHLLTAHPGHHVDPATLGALPVFFCRVLRLPWRKPAAPADRHAAGAATAGAEPVLGDRMVSEVRAESDARQRARQHADAMHAGYAAAADRLRQEAGLPTVDQEAAELMRAEYIRSQTAETAASRDPETLQRVLDGLVNLDKPAPVFGQAPVADVLEAEQAGQVIA